MLRLRVPPRAPPHQQTERRGERPIEQASRKSLRNGASAAIQEPYPPGPLRGPGLRCRGSPLRTRAWAEEIATEALTLYGADVREAIAYAFGAEPSRLRRRTKSRHVPDCYLRVRSSAPAWEVEIRFDSDRVTATPPDAGAWLASALDPGSIRQAIRRMPQAEVRLLRTRTFTDVMRSQYDETARLVNELIEAGIE